MRPKVIWQKGDERRTPKGKSIGGARESSYCCIDFGAASKIDLSKKIEGALKSLKPHRVILRRLASTGGRSSFFIGWFCEEDAGEEFDYRLLASMAGLHLALDLCVYVPDRAKGRREISAAQ
jgi:hypothetical protein